MPTTAIGATGAAAASPLQDRGLDSLRSEDFFKILVTELQQQDPMEPNKTSDMISQVSQIRSIELSGQLTDTLGQLAQQQRASGASDLIGKYVQAAMQAEDGAPVVIDGVVTGVQFASDGSATLELDTGMAVRATDVFEVTTAEIHEQRLRDGGASGPLIADAASGATSRLRWPFNWFAPSKNTPAPEAAGAAKPSRWQL